MVIRARYRYILEVNSPRDGGWVRVFDRFESAAESEQCYELFAPLAGFSAEIHIDMRVRKSNAKDATHKQLLATPPTTEIRFTSCSPPCLFVFPRVGVEFCC